MRRRGLAVTLLAPALARAQGNAIRIIVPYAPGGGADQAARLVAGPMGAALGQNIVIEIRTGGGGSIGAALVAQARPDGQTLLVEPSSHIANHVLLRGLTFDYARDFAPIALLSTLPLLLVVPVDDPAVDLAAWMGRLRERPGQVSYSSSGNGTASHLAAALFLRAAGLTALHVTYRGGAQAVQDVVAGNVGFSLATVSTAVPLIQGGRMRALAVTTRARLAALPQVPTIAEAAVPGFDTSEWIGLYAPVATPDAVLDRLHAASQQALGEASVRARLEATGSLPAARQSRAAFAGFVAERRAETTRLLAEAQITAD